MKFKIVLISSILFCLSCMPENFEKLLIKEDQSSLIKNDCGIFNKELGTYFYIDYRLKIKALSDSVSFFPYRLRIYADSNLLDYEIGNLIYDLNSDSSVLAPKNYSLFYITDTERLKNNVDSLKFIGNKYFKFDSTECDFYLKVGLISPSI